MVIFEPGQMNHLTKPPEKPPSPENAHTMIYKIRSWHANHLSNKMSEKKSLKNNTIKSDRGREEENNHLLQLQKEEAPKLNIEEQQQK